MHNSWMDFVKPKMSGENTIDLQKILRMEITLWESIKQPHLYVFKLSLWRLL